MSAGASSSFSVGFIGWLILFVLLLANLVTMGLISYHPLMNPGGTTRLFFVVGTKGAPGFLKEQIARENALHFNDIINFEDESNDADRGKKFLRFVKYIDKHYKYKYFVKADDDTFIHSVQLERDMRSLKPQHRTPLYWGMGWITTPAHICGHATTRYWFMTGSTVVVSRDIMTFIANEMSDRYESCQATEDLRLGLWVQLFENTTKTKVNINQTDAVYSIHRYIDQQGDYGTLPQTTRSHLISLHIAELKSTQMSTLLPWLQHLMPYDIFERPEDYGAIDWRNLIRYFERSFNALVLRGGENYLRIELAFPGLYESVPGLIVDRENFMSASERKESLDRVRQYLESNKNHIDPKKADPLEPIYGVENVHHSHHAALQLNIR